MSFKRKKLINNFALFALFMIMTNSSFINTNIKTKRYLEEGEEEEEDKKPFEMQFEEPSKDDFAPWKISAIIVAAVIVIIGIIILIYFIVKKSTESRRIKILPPIKANPANQNNIPEENENENISSIPNEPIEDKN